MQHVALLITLSLATLCCAPPYDDKKDRLVSWKFDIFPGAVLNDQDVWKMEKVYTYDRPIILRIKVIVLKNVIMVLEKKIYHDIIK